MSSVTNLQKHRRDNTPPEELEAEKELVAKIKKFSLPKSLADRNREAAKLKKTAKSNTMATATQQQQDSNTKATVTEHDNGVVTTPFLGKKATVTEHNSNTISNTQKSNTIATPLDNNVRLPKKQLEIYNWFLLKGLKGTFNKPLIVSETGIAYETIRKALRKFNDLGILSVTYDKSLKIYLYEINADVHIENNNYGHHSNSNTTATGQHFEKSSYNSSSSYLKKLTTIENFTAEEFPFWFELKLTGKQIMEWGKKFEIPVNDILDFLRYAEFDFIDNDKLNKPKPIPNPLGYFYKILEKTHTYNKPINYKSFNEKKIEKEKAELEKIQAELDELRKLREQKENLHIELAFEKMMADPEGELYNKCFDSCSNMIKTKYKRLTDRKGASFLSAMKSAFKKLDEN